jgi:hypothetical protein
MIFIGLSRMRALKRSLHFGFCRLLYRGFPFSIETLLWRLSCGLPDVPAQLNSLPDKMSNLNRRYATLEPEGWQSNLAHFIGWERKI